MIRFKTEEVCEAEGPLRGTMQTKYAIEISLGGHFFVLRFKNIEEVAQFRREAIFLFTPEENRFLDAIDGAGEKEEEK